MTLIISIFFVSGCNEEAKNSWHESEFVATSEEQGQHLYLDRNIGIVTHRAKFDYAADCNLLQQQIQRKEPDVSWFCAGKAEQ
ncbi:TPA: hypothetical protein ACOEGU_001375 [Enterobacter ludwigii]